MCGGSNNKRDEKCRMTILMSVAVFKSRVERVELIFRMLIFQRQKQEHPQKPEGLSTYFYHRFLSTIAKKRRVLCNMVVLRRLLEGANDKQDRRLYSSPPLSCCRWCYGKRTNFFTMLLLDFGNKIATSTFTV